MDAPQSPPAVKYSPIFEEDFLSSLSPLATPVQLLMKSPKLPPISSIFTSPKLTIRDDVKLSQELNPNHQMDSSTFERNVQENELALALEAQKRCKLRGGNIISSTSILAVDQGSLEDARRQHFIEPFGSYIQSAADDAHVYCTDAAAGFATNHDQEMLPAVIQNQLVSNDCNFDTFEVSIDGTAISQQQYGNDEVGPSNKTVQNISNIHHASICGNNYLKPVDPAVCALPGIGLHLNTVNPPLVPEQTGPETVISGRETILYGREVCTHVDDYSSQKTMPDADKSDRQIHKKRRKLQNDDGESCRRCSCKKSKCLKLYCACFAAKAYCSKFCSCQGCSNNDTHEEEVSCIRKQTESRNPQAFAPTVTRTCGPVSKFGDDSNKTPASARHKRGCNCRKSSCLKKYCECFQSGVGCSISCRCESCKNSFGKREGTHGEEEKLAAGCSSELHNPLSPMLSPGFRARTAKMILRNEFSDIQEVGSSCTTSVKVVSPNKKRIVPPHIGTALSPIGSSSRKLVFESIPSLPPLTGDADTEPQ